MPQRSSSSTATASSTAEFTTRESLRTRVAAMQTRRMKKNVIHKINSSNKRPFKKRKHRGKIDMNSFLGETLQLQVDHLNQNLVQEIACGEIDECSHPGACQDTSVSEPSLGEQSEARQPVPVHSAIVTTTGSRPKNEDTHIERYEVEGGTLKAVFDGHGGKQISELAEKRVTHLLNPELVQRREVIENGSLDEAHLAVAEAFNACTDNLHQEIGRKFLSGGSTALFIYQTPRCIFMHNMGDCRATVSTPDGEIKTAPRALVDGAFLHKSVVDKGFGLVQTHIHAMNGDAVWREDVTEEQRMAPVVCTMESMSRMRIENDDQEESAYEEWRAYNIAHCSSLIDLQNKCKNSSMVKPIIHSSHPALLPKKDWNANAWRLSPCKCQPTRGLRGIKERVLPNGQTWRYDISMEECSREGLLLMMGCDGVEDNHAIDPSMIMKCLVSIDTFLAQIDNDNLLHKYWNGFESYPHSEGIREKLQCMHDHADDIRHIDRFWIDSIAKSAGILIEMLDDGRLEYAFAGTSQHQLELRCKAFVELINCSGSADNVTVGLTSFK